MKSKKRSPLKDKPLRTPGQSIDRQRLDLAYDKLLTPLTLTVFLCSYAGIEWWADFRDLPRSPRAYGILAFLAVVYTAWQWWRYMPQLRSLRLAAEGEKAVGQFLERLRSLGYEVYHDIEGPNFNLDHVVIGPAGIFTIETKTYSKPTKGKPSISFDGEKILVAGYEPDRDPIIQGKAQASWLRALLAESTGRKFPVHPVVVFPGWFIENSPGAMRDIWVLEPKALPGFLAQQAAVMKAEDIKLASFHLSRFIRSSERTRLGK